MAGEIKLEKKVIEAKGLRTAYLEGGSPSRQPLVLLHSGGYGSDAMGSWEALWPYVVDRFWVIAPDLPGYGDTDKVISFPDPFELRLSHLAHFLSLVGVRHPVLMGSSFGGGVILRCLAADRLSAVAAVSISGAGGLMHTSGAARSHMHKYEPTWEWMERSCRYLVRRPTRKMIEWRLAQSRIPGHYEALTAGRVRPPETSATGSGSDSSVRARSLIDELATSRVPTLFVAGGGDELLEPGWEMALSEKSECAESYRFDELLHEPHLEEPERAWRVVAEFLNRQGVS